MALIACLGLPVGRVITLRLWSGCGITMCVMRRYTTCGTDCASLSCVHNGYKCTSDITVTTSATCYFLATIPQKCRVLSVGSVLCRWLAAGAGMWKSCPFKHWARTRPILPIPTIHLTHFQNCMPGRASRHALVRVRNRHSEHHRPKGS
jgi:hypothetical protein